MIHKIRDTVMYTLCESYLLRLVSVAFLYTIVGICSINSANLVLYNFREKVNYSEVHFKL